MTPAQIAAVEETMRTVDLDVVVVDFYRRAFAADPQIAAMFTTDPATQRRRFALELSTIVRSIRDLDAFRAQATELGARHRGYGVRAAHYRTMGAALLGAFAEAFGERWTDEMQEAWALAFNLIAEMMLTGALDPIDPQR